MCFGLKNINFEYFHTTASFIKNLLHLRVILIPMARQMSKYTVETSYDHFEVVLGTYVA